MRLSKRILAAAFLAAILPTLVPLADTHQATVDTTSPVNAAADDASVWDAFPTLTGDGQGNYVAIWVPTIDRCEPLVAYSSDRGVSWSEQFPLKTNIGLDDGWTDTYPAVATDGGGTWVAVWTSTDTLEGTTDSNDDILGARSTDNGANWSAPALVSAPTSFYSIEPDVAGDGQGNWIACWTGSGLQTARSTDDGLTWDEPVTHYVTHGAHRHARIATDRAGTWIVVWETSESFGLYGSDRDVFYTLSSDVGQTWSPALPVNNDALGLSHTDKGPEIAHADNTWIVVWEASGGAGSPLGDDFDLLYARSTGAARSWTDPLPLNSDAATDATRKEDLLPSIHVDAHGTWFVAWDTNKSPAGTWGARSDDAGATWTQAASLGFGTGITDTRQTVRADASGNWLVVRQSAHSLGGAIGDDRDVLSTRFRMPFGGTCTADLDRDGFGSPGDGSCPLGATTDCDDDDLRVAPGAVQSCDGINNDCTHAAWPALAGTNESDDDGDSYSECAGDCDDSDPLSWSMPGTVAGVRMDHDHENDGGSLLTWDVPAVPGGDPSALVYDVLRSEAPYGCNLLGAQICLETDDGADRMALDLADPAPGKVFFYQVRAENGCPGPGKLGNASPWRLRIAVTCE